MYATLTSYIYKREREFDAIPRERKEALAEIARYVDKESAERGECHLSFICTHNSRRSQLAQIWAQAAAAHYDITEVETYSGGTEATAFHPSAVAALQRAGFQIQNPGGENPRYVLRFAKEEQPMICYSKTFDDPANPQSGFAALMTCSDADENCPLIPGADFRQPVTYRDPKEADGTKQEAETYGERCRQIAREMLYMMSIVGN